MLLYAFTILVSAFLLFQVQPVIAKIILPWFGGSAAVWTTCLLFFQMALLLGYLYAHAVVRYLRPRAQMLLHSGLLLVSAAALPIYPSLARKPAGTEQPTLAILGLLAITVGLPYFMLATTGPLIQAWYARRFKTSMPYRLYALSNAGSMFALISYPVLFEPTLTTHQQSSMWSIAYGVFVVLCGFTAFRAGNAPDFGLEAEVETAEKPGARQYALWLALPACASALLLAITNHLSQNVAAIPFLWVLPLSIYLLTFILCFESSGWYRRYPYLPLLAVALASMTFTSSVDTLGNVPLKLMVPLFCMALFTCCMVCHGELVRLKPHPRYLTHFYLMISAGGALGGIFVGLVAPYLFNALYDLHLAMIACAAVVLIALSGDREAEWTRNLLPPSLIGVAAVSLTAIGIFAYDFRGGLLSLGERVVAVFVKDFNEPDDFIKRVLLVFLLMVAVPGLLLLRGLIDWRRQYEVDPGDDQTPPAATGALRKWRSVAAECLVLVLAGYLGYEMRELTREYRLSVRNFYGALRVRDSGPPSDFTATRTLTHGTINHGEEFLNPARLYLPTTYYGPDTGVGVAIREQGKNRAIRVGVIGLGTGTLAAYARLGDYFRFYEINPLVPGIAKTQFHFVPDAKGKVEIAMGDARLSLEREADENFDVLAVDAFSSDSIPVHLLTREAMALYFRRLSPDGILAVHISNRYLNLQPVLAGEARALGKTARLFDTDDDESTGVFGATWVLLASSEKAFDGEGYTAGKHLATDGSGVRLWTDDYSNLFQILK